MSVQAVAWALDQYIRDAATKLVLISLANYADKKTGECWPTIARICEESCQSKSTVLRRLDWLVEHGLVVKSEMHETSGRQKANHYRLVLSRLLTQDDVASLQGHSENVREGGCQAETLPMQGEGVTVDTPEGVTADTPIEPLEEPKVTPIAPKGAGEANDRDEEFEEFLRAYDPPPMASRLTPRRHWNRLTADERKRAKAAIGPYRAACAAERPKPRKMLDPSAYLSRRIFDNFAGALKPRPPEAPAVAALRRSAGAAFAGARFVECGTAAWRAWEAVASEAAYPLRAVILPPRPMAGRDREMTGRYFPSEWPPTRDGPDLLQKAAGER
ncbi:helix-turn-helix domain-containing protein [Ancylobacter sp. MQZ15Z-1]|uniref:Helix-turn-helix domain-containing protein n=1 Tax=Ancylobacter mangrovi TaxID=2972472 RepID=A0A9X2PKS3_9HYPH|nr:helix-turn-helix domain-containing protein [Ancylobacter mangrovi]MCS0497880.1 helix-turn-helix domain-containing protein [Ancylobacter mangrovi]